MLPPNRAEEMIDNDCDQDAPRQTAEIRPAS
jgi:hypothetical protein